MKYHYCSFFNSVATFRNRSGTVLIWSLSMTMLVLITILGYFPQFSTSTTIMARYASQSQACALAEAGVEEALWEANFFARDTRVGIASACLNAPCSNQGKLLVDFAPPSAVTSPINGADLTAAQVSYFQDAVNGLWLVCSPPDPDFANCRQRTRIFVDGINNAQAGQFTVRAMGFDFNPLASDFRPSIYSVGQSTGETCTVEVILDKAPSLMSFGYAAYAAYILFEDNNLDPNLAPYIDSYNSLLGPYGTALGTEDPYYGWNNKSDQSLPSSWQANLSWDTNNGLLQMENEGKLVIDHDTDVFGDVHVDRQAERTYSSGDPQGSPPSTIRGAYRERLGEVDLPQIQFPAGESWSVPDELTFPPSGVILDAYNNLRITGPGVVWTCDQPIQVNTLWVDEDATLILDDGCEIFIAFDLHGEIMPPMDPGWFIGHALQVDSGGLIESHGNNKLWMPGGPFQINSSGGLTTDADPGAPGRQILSPDNLQIFVGESPYGLTLKQPNPFSGTIYAPSYNLDLIPYGNTYFEIFGSIVIGGNLRFFRNTTDSGRVRLHYDVQLSNLRLDGDPNVTTCQGSNDCYIPLTWQVLE